MSITRESKKEREMYVRVAIVQAHLPWFRLLEARRALGIFNHFSRCNHHLGGGVEHGKHCNLSGREWIWCSGREWIWCYRHRNGTYCRAEKQRQAEHENPVGGCHRIAKSEKAATGGNRARTAAKAPGGTNLRPAGRARLLAALPGLQLKCTAPSPSFRRGFIGFGNFGSLESGGVGVFTIHRRAVR